MAKHSNNVIYKKLTIITIASLLFITFLNKKEISSHQFKISTDIFYIDGNRWPLSNLTVTLFKLKSENQWITVDKRITDVDGNISSFVSTNKEEFTPGTYRLHLETKEYFNSQDRKTSFPFIEMAFDVDNTEQRHHFVVHVNAMDGWGFHLKMLPEPTVDKSNSPRGSDMFEFVALLSLIFIFCVVCAEYMSGGGRPRGRRHKHRK